MTAADWPEWRGAGRAGVWVEDGILERFPEEGLNVVWRVPIGSGYAGPAVSGGRVFVLDWERDPESRQLGGTERLHVLDEEDGSQLWSRTWPASYAVLMQSYAIGPRATPTVHGGKVYVVGAVGNLRAYDSASGDLLWAHDLRQEMGTSVPTWGVASAPIVHGELLINVAGAEPHGKVVAFDLDSGEERWRALSSDWEMGYGQPILIDAGGRRQLIVWEPKALHGMNPDSGEVYWSQPFDVSYGMTVATPVYDDGRLLVTQFYGGSMMLALGDAAPTAALVWQGESRSELPDRTDGLHSLITTPILEGDMVYGVGSYGELRGLDAATGERLWLESDLTRQGRWGTAFFVRNGDRWFMNNDLGELMILRLSRSGPELVDKTRLIEPTSRAGIGPRRSFDAAVNWSHPAYANRHIVARNDHEILRASLAAPAAAAVDTSSAR